MRGENTVKVNREIHIIHWLSVQSNPGSVRSTKPRKFAWYLFVESFDPPMHDRCSYSLWYWADVSKY